MKTKETICKIFKTLELEQASCHCELEPGCAVPFLLGKNGHDGRGFALHLQETCSMVSLELWETQA